LSFDAAYGLIQFAGGMEALGANLGTYYTNFYSEEEQRLQTIKNINAATVGSGLDAATATRESFRAIVEAQDLTTESGQKTYAALISVSGAFAGLTPVLESVAAAVDTALGKMQADAASLAVELLAAQGDTAGAAAAQRAIDTAGYSDLAIAQYDANTATRALIESTLAAADAATALAAANLDNAQTAARDAMAALQRAVDAQRKIYQVQAEAAQGAVTEIKSIFDTLDRSIKTLYGQVDSAQSAAAGRAFISNALANAQSTGYLPDSAALGDAVQAAMNDSTVYASQAEADFARLSLAGTMGQLKDLTGDQLTIAEKQLQMAKDQLTRLDDTLVMAQRQLDAANGINTSVLSVEQALDKFAAAVLNLSAIRASQGLPTTAPVESLTSTTQARASGYITSPVSSTGSHTGIGDSGYRLVGSTLYFPGGGSHTVSSPGGAELLRSTYGLQAGGLNGTLVRTRAAGGYTPPGMAWVGEEGPELVNFDRPAMVYTAGQSRSMSGQGNARLEALVEGLTAEVKRLQTLVNDGNQSNERIASTLDNVTEGGANMRTVTT
jgi:hypothetical protein